MRIGFDAKRLYSNFSGLGNYSRTLVRNLKQFYPGNAYLLYTTKVRHASEMKDFAGDSGYECMRYNGFLKALWRSYGITNQLKKDQIDVYHGLSNELPFNISKSGIKSVVTIHDLIFRKYPMTYPLIDREIYDKKFRHSCRCADRIITVSQSTKNDIIEFYKTDPSKIEVIYQSCNPLYYTRQGEEESNAIRMAYDLPEEYVLYVGNIEPRKNLKLIIESYRLLPDCDKVPLVIVGRGRKYSNEVSTCIASAGIGKWVIWLAGIEDHKHLQAIYQRAMCLIYPSLYEGFGLPVAEALLSKTPVITSATSSMPEAGGPFSRYIDPGNAEELANAMKSVIGQSALRETMKEKGYLYAKDKFDPAGMANAMMKVYTGVIQAGD